MRKPIEELKKDVLVILLFALLAIGMTYPLISHITDHVPSDLGDPLYNVWVMARQFHELKAGLKNFWDGNIFYPHKSTLLYADYLFAEAVMGAPLAAISNNFIFVHNVLFIFSFFLCALGMYFLVFYLTKSRTSAIIAGLIFAFFPYRFAHISHLELLSFGWIPFCFLFLHKFFDRPSYKNLTGIGFFYVLQALSCAYYSVFLALFVGLFIIYFSYKKNFFQRFDFWLKMGILSLACFIVLFPFFYPYIKVHQKMSFTRSLEEVNYYSAQIQHFLSAPVWNVAWGWLIGNRGSPEWQVYPGLMALFLTIFWWISRRNVRSAEIREEGNKAFFWWDLITALYLFLILQIVHWGGFSLHWAGIKWLSIHSLRNPLIILGISLSLRVILGIRRRRRLKRVIPPTISLAQRFYFFLVILACLLSLGPEIRYFGRTLLAGPYLALYEWIPGFQGLRAPNRFVAMMMLGISLLAGWGAARWAEKWRLPYRQKITLLIFGGLIILDYLSIPIPLAPVEVGEEIPRIYSDVKALPESSILIELPMPENIYEKFHEARYMYYSLFHWKRMVNGYSGYFPPGYTIVREAMACFPYEKTLALLRDLGVTNILIHTRGFHSDKGIEAVERLREFKNQVELMNEVDGDYLYQILPEPKAKRGEAAITEVAHRENWKASSSPNEKLAKLAFDGNIKTGWSTVAPQREGDFFILDLGSAIQVSLVELLLGDYPLEYPRAFRLEGSVDNSNWIILSEDSCSFPALSQSMVEDFSTYRLSISFELMEVRYLRIRLTKSDKTYYWSIQEIYCKG